MGTAPPYPRVFVECQTRAGAYRDMPLHAFGFLFSGADLTDPVDRSQVPDLRLGTVLTALRRAPVEVPDDVAEREVRWILAAHPVIEPRKGRPCGPVAEYLFPLGPDGCLIRNGDGDTVSVEGLVEMDVPLGHTLEQHLLTRIDSLLLPALFALSLMHCRNVTVRSVEPPPALAKKASRHHGRRLTRYHVLDIAPLREILDGKGEAKRHGLRHALHLCRGHFETFTPEAPTLRPPRRPVLVGRPRPGNKEARPGGEGLSPPAHRLVASVALPFMHGSRNQGRSCNRAGGSEP